MPTRITPRVDISTRYTYLSRAGISQASMYGYISSRRTSLAGHASRERVLLICISQVCTSQAVHIRVVHLTGCAQLMGACISWACISGLVSFAGMHLKGLQLVGAYISQNVHLRCLYLMGVALSRARISQACILSLPCLSPVVPKLCPWLIRSLVTEVKNWAP